MKPQIAYIVNSLNVGGTEHLVVQMSRALADEYTITVICLDEPGPWAHALRQSGIPVYAFYRQPGLDISMAYRIARFSKRHQIQIIHAHQCTPWFYAALSRYIYGRPKLLFEEHGRHYPEIDSPPKRIVNRLLVHPMTHRTVAVSQDVRKRLVAYEGVPGEKIEVVYNGVYAKPTLTPEQILRTKTELGFTAHDFIVGFVGRFDPIKNLPLLLGSLETLKPVFPGLKALLVGDGPEFATLCQRIAACGLSDRITLTGYREDAAQLIQCMDLFVLPSFSEGTSLALLEAMAARVAVAVTDVGGNPEIIHNGRTGWVFPSDSEHKLTAIISEAIQTPRKRAALAEKGLARFRETFSFDAMLGRYRAIYRDLIGRR